MYGVATPLCVGVNFPTPTFTKEKVHFRFLFSGEEPHIIFLGCGIMFRSPIAGNFF